MKFQFKQQPYQADAVAAVVRVFAGQSCQEPPRFCRREAGLYGADEDGGFANRSVELSDEQLLANIQAVQSENGIHGSHALKRGWAGAAWISIWKPERARPMSISARCLS